MSEIAQRYHRLAARFADRIAAVPDGRWDDPTPCEGWSVRTLVNHVVETQSKFRGLVGREPITTPDPATDPATAWDAARTVMQADLDDPARAAAGYEGAFGRGTFEEAVDQFLNLDLIVHGWDLARATGQDERIPSEDLAHVRAQADNLGDMMRRSGAFGPAVEVPADADEQARVLALLGRRA